MQAFDTPVVDYRATSLRPGWDSLPAAVAAAVGRRCGMVRRALVAGGGFTPTFAGTIITTTGPWFLKAAPLDGPFGATLQREARILAAMPAGLPTPELRWSETVDGWVLMCLAVIDGHMPGQPWTLPDLQASLDAQAKLCAVLAEPPLPLAQAVADKAFGPFAEQHLRAWRTALAADGLPPVPDWLTGRISELVELEALLPTAVAGSGGVMHWDTRADNILIADGTATILDWNFAQIGPGFVDVVMLLPSALGHADIDTLLARHPATADIAPDIVDAVLASVGGVLLHNSMQPVPETSPHLRHHQRGQAGRALTWLGNRRGWTR